MVSLMVVWTINLDLTFNTTSDIDPFLIMINYLMFDEFFEKRIGNKFSIWLL